MAFKPVNKEEAAEDAGKDDRIDAINKAIDSLEAKVKDNQIDPDFIKRHPPVDGFMDLELKRAQLRSITPDQTELVEPCMVLPLDADVKLKEGEYILVDPKTKKNHKICVYDTLFRTDLRTLIQAQFYECPATVFPVIAERLEETARHEREAKFPDNRTDKKDYFWLILIIMVPVLVVIAFTMI